MPLSSHLLESKNRSSDLLKTWIFGFVSKLKTQVKPNAKSEARPNRNHLRLVKRNNRISFKKEAIFPLIANGTFKESAHSYGIRLIRRLNQHPNKPLLFRIKQDRAFQMENSPELWEVRGQRFPERSNACTPLCVRKPAPTIGGHLAWTSANT